MMDAKELKRRYLEHYEHPKGDLRAKLIDAVSDHEGWEESAIALVDEALMPVINEHARSAGTPSDVREAFRENSFVDGDKRVITGNLVSPVPATMTNSTSASYQFVPNTAPAAPTHQPVQKTPDKYDTIEWQIMACARNMYTGSESFTPKEVGDALMEVVRRHYPKRESGELVEVCHQLLNEVEILVENADHQPCFTWKTAKRLKAIVALFDDEQGRKA